MIFLSPAKINLILKITGRDPKDGYHYLDSVFDPVSLYDIIDIEKISGDAIEVVDHFKQLNIPAEKNLIHKAALLVKKQCGIKGGIKITFYKYIPSGAGLGGGSSNAATVIKGMNCIFKQGLTTGEMARLGFKLGSDVPFFIYSKASYVFGKGNKIRAFSDMDKYWYVICVPKGIRVATKEAYDWYDDEKNLTKAVPYIKLVDVRKKDFSKLLENDFESSVFKRYGKLKELKEDFLRHGGENAGLSGSGSAVYGLFKDRRGARECYKKIRRAWRGCFISLAHSI
jgi:4-diphosphocytidyl-2-C-methyl-D-erythritol kinase